MGGNWALKDEALVDVVNEIVVQLVLINLRSSRPFSRSSDIRSYRHPIGNFLTLVDDLSIQTFSVHGLVQNLLHVH